MIKKHTLAIVLLTQLGYSNAEPLAIVDFSVETVEILDAQGKVVEELPVASLPKLDILVVDRNEDLDLLAIENNNGEVIWLDAYYVKLNQGKIVDLPCYKISQTSSKDSRETGTMGFGGTCENAN